MANNKLPKLDGFQRNAMAFACKWMLPDDVYTLRSDNGTYVFYAKHHKATLEDAGRLEITAYMQGVWKLTRTYNYTSDKWTRWTNTTPEDFHIFVPTSEVSA